MSFGYPLENNGYGYLEPELDANYFAPALAANPGVTFLASTGDAGAANGLQLSLRFTAGRGRGRHDLDGQRLQCRSYSWGGETAWYGGGGGISNTYSEPTWQQSVQSTGSRTVPDVSADANPNTGLAVYDPYDFGARPPGTRSRRYQPVVTDLGRPDRDCRPGPHHLGRRHIGRPQPDPAGPVRPQRRWDQLCSPREQHRWEQLLPRHHGGQQLLLRRPRLRPGDRHRLSARQQPAARSSRPLAFPPVRSA